MLSPEEFAKAMEHYDRTGLGRSSTSTARPEVSIGRGKLTRMEEIDHHLKLLRGIELNGGQSKWFGKLGEVFNIAKNLKCELVILDREEQDRAPQFNDSALNAAVAAGTLTKVTYTRPYMEVAVGPRKLKNINEKPRIKSDDPRDLKTKAPDEPSFPIPGEPIVFDFFTSDLQADSEQLVASLPQHWTALWALHTAKAAAQTGSDQKRLWLVPLLVRDGQGKPVHYYWIGMRFTNDISSALVESGWPTVDDWIAAGIRG
jgi:hypothetical protein